MKGMKSCPKCKGGECKGGKKGGKIEIEISMPMRGSRTAKSKAKKT